MFEPRQIEEKQRLHPRQRMVVIGMNLLLLGELTWAMYLGQQTPDELTPVFLRTFLPLAAATLVVAKILTRKLQPTRRDTPINGE